MRAEARAEGGSVKGPRGAALLTEWSYHSPTAVQGHLCVCERETESGLCNFASSSSMQIHDSAQPQSHQWTLALTVMIREPPPKKPAFPAPRRDMRGRRQRLT